jgi:hypothetical protein
MFDNFFYDHTCTIYSLWVTKVSWAEKESKTIIYDNIPCAIWSISSNNLNDWEYWRKQDTATHKINVDWQYSNNITIGNIFVIWDREYQLIDIVTYNDTDDSTDNSSFYVRIR